MNISPRAHRKNTIVSGNVRFTILTDRMIRLEWSSSGRFDDRETQVVCHRALPAVPFSAETKGSSLVLSTGRLIMTCSDTKQRFSPKSLNVAFVIDGRRTTWRFGDKDTGNLLGTMHSLDGMRGNRKGDARGVEREWLPHKGLLSRDGWVYVDDTNGCAIEELPSGQARIVPRDTKNYQDGYFMAYGREYTEALHDASLVFGRQPLPPASALGYWYCKYWAFTHGDYRVIIDKHERLGVPISVLVLDMDWHKPGWVGYSWDRDYFPDPREFLAWLHKRKVRSIVNLHPCEKIGRHEDAFDAFSRDLGMSRESTEGISFNPADTVLAAAYQRRLLDPNTDLGVDGWFIDTSGPDAPPLSTQASLHWTNRLHWNHLHNRGKRPLFLSRFAGLGSGRYPMGFSGDTVAHWGTLKYQVYFTATSANALFGYWSHDIGGFFDTTTDPELYTRWLQFGAFSPVLRTHCNVHPKTERRVTEFAEPHGPIMRDVIRLRNEMFPYIYTACKQCEETGVSLVRPLYYQWPCEPQAYRAKDQYLFGDLLLVKPITTPASRKTGMSSVDLWLPRGTWFDLFRHEMLTGPALVKRSYLLSEMPVFARAGSVLVGRGDKGPIAKGFSEHLMVTVIPGAGGQFELYEDDGISLDHEKGRFVKVLISHMSTDKLTEIRIHPARGKFAGWKPQRGLEIRLPATPPPRSVVWGNRRLRMREGIGADGWSCDGASSTVVIRIARVDLAAGASIRIVHDASIPRDRALNVKGMISRAQHLRAVVTDAVQGEHLYVLPRLAARHAHTCERIAMQPQSFAAEFADLRRGMAAFPNAIADCIREYKKCKEEKWGIPSRAEALRMLKKALAISREIAGDTG